MSVTFNDLTLLFGFERFDFASMGHGQVILDEATQAASDWETVEVRHFHTRSKCRRTLICPALTRQLADHSRRLSRSAGAAQSDRPPRLAVRTDHIPASSHPNPAPSATSIFRRAPPPRAGRLAGVGHLERRESCGQGTGRVELLKGPLRKQHICLDH